MLYENFYYMVLTRHSAGKIWSSVCTQDTVSHNCVTLSNWSGAINLTCKLIKGKSDEKNYLYVQNTEAN